MLSTFFCVCYLFICNESVKLFALSIQYSRGIKNCLTLIVLLSSLIVQHVCFFFYFFIFFLMILVSWSTVITLVVDKKNYISFFMLQAVFNTSFLMFAT